MLLLLLSGDVSVTSKVSSQQSGLFRKSTISCKLKYRGIIKLYLQLNELVRITEENYRLTGNIMDIVIRL